MLKLLTLSFALLFCASVQAQTDCSIGTDPDTGEAISPIPGDHNSDHRIDVYDLAIQLSLYGCVVDENTPNYCLILNADINSDGIVSVSDLLNFISVFGLIYE